MQTTSNILMVRPANFAFNAETAENNAFQSRDAKLTPQEMREQAQVEFDGFVARLRAAGVNVIVAEDTAEPVKPDAVFPNNWVSFHADGTIITYPMFAHTRRLERSEAIINQVVAAGFSTNGVRHHFENSEAVSLYLEGTGSIVFDHDNRLAYACVSVRTDANLLNQLCQTIGYEPVLFTATDASGQKIYHTNVMMAMGDTFVVICLDSVPDQSERHMLIDTFEHTGKAIIDISLDQMNAFAGNMLQVRNKEGQTFLVMSEQAFKALAPDQVQLIEQHTNILHAPIYTIETYGGGSARCMMAEVFLPEKQD